ncbi:GspH/FimT family pseudopilin [Psychromonas sp. PT13]|uniref:GspH/FimT family pseudopilin n=1 Tax=Psychromonas sp. PT13 TaxID=3439547 RepID=UPI003EC05FCB
MISNYCKHGGLTLIELMISLAVLAILMSIGIASYSGLFSQQALINRTERIYHFLRLANTQAVKFNHKVYVQFCQLSTTDNWKMAMSANSGCDCFTLNSCQLDGIEVIEDVADGKTLLTSAADITFSGEQASYSPMRFGINTGSITLSGTNGLKLKVIQSTMRLRICAPEKDQLGYKKC